MPKVNRKAPDEEHTQSIVFEKSAGWTEESSRKWCEEHDYFTDGMDETEKQYRWRQFDPDYEAFIYRNKEVEANSIALVLGIPKRDAAEYQQKEMVMRYSYVMKAFVETPWAILPHKLAILEEIVIRHTAGEKLDPEEVQMRIHGAKRPAERRSGNVAVLPLFGTIFPRANLMTQVSGATSAEMFGRQFDELVKDPEVKGIVLDVDSPGGQVGGIEELSRQIYAARGIKPIVAVANHVMDSAAYYIGSAAEEVVVTPSGEVGSIGVFAVHEDISKQLEQDGVKLTVIKEGKYKVEGNPWEPLNEEAKAAIQQNVKDAYDAFVNSVARNRGKTAEIVREGFGEGRTVGASRAVELGMADTIGTLDETVNRVIRQTFTLSDDQRLAAEELHAKVEQILRKEL
jgi:signal peptide peptidase SppA